MAGQFTAANRIIGFKEEVTAGMFVEPLAADYNIECFDVGSLSFDTSPARIGKPANGNMTQTKSKSGQIFATGLTVKTRLIHSGSEEVNSKLVKLFEVAGLKPIAVDGVAGFEYDGTQPCKTLSVVVSELNCGTAPAAVQAKGRGASCNLVINGAGVGQELDCTFEFSCAKESEVDNATPIKALTGIDTGPTEKLLGTVVTIGAQTFIMHNFNLNHNNSVSKIDDPSKTGGVFQFKVKEADPVLTMSLQMIDLATSGIPAAVMNDTDFTNITIGGVYFDLIVTEGNIRKNTKGEADSIITNEIEIEVRKYKLMQKVIVVA